MAVPPNLPELATGEAKDYFEHYRTGVIGPSEEVEFFTFLNTLQQKYGKTFKLRDITKRNFDYTEIENKRLDSEWHRWLKRQDKQDSPGDAPQGPAAPTINDKAKQVGQGATKALLGEVQEIGNMLVLECGAKAALRGESLKTYIMNCIEMREQYGDQVEALLQENGQLKVLCSMFVDVVKPQFKQMAVSRMYLDWTTGLMQLQALGIQINQEWVDQVTSRIEQAMRVNLLQ